jgi:hypothetical protein
MRNLLNPNRIDQDHHIVRWSDGFIDNAWCATQHELRINKPTHQELQWLR